MSPLALDDLADSVRSLLKAEGIGEQDKERAIASLSECALKTKCKEVYLKYIYKGGD